MSKINIKTGFNRSDVTHSTQLNPSLSVQYKMTCKKDGIKFYCISLFTLFFHKKFKSLSSFSLYRRSNHQVNFSLLNLIEPATKKHLQQHKHGYSTIVDENKINDDIVYLSQTGCSASGLVSGVFDLTSLFTSSVTHVLFDSRPINK